MARYLSVGQVLDGCNLLRSGGIISMD